MLSAPWITCLLPLQDEPDFVRLAVKCKALIVPFAAVGADDAYDIMMVGGWVREWVHGSV
jgi:hypothetical protein